MGQAPSGGGRTVGRAFAHSGSRADCCGGDAGEEVEALQRRLANFGYAIPVNGSFDTATGHVVRAFQRHFRPERVDGIADPSTIETLARLTQTREAAERE